MLDGKPPLTWNVYQPEKKRLSYLILVLVGKRYLVLDTKSKLVYLLFPNELHNAGKFLESPNPVKPSRLIPSTDWVEHDVGPAEAYSMILKDYGTTLDVRLPHPIDLRSPYF